MIIIEPNRPPVPKVWRPRGVNRPVMDEDILQEERSALDEAGTSVQPGVARGSAERG